MAVQVQGEGPIATLDRGAAALEQIGTLSGDLLEVETSGDAQRLDRMRRMLRRCKPPSAHGEQGLAGVVTGAARGDPFQIELERRDQVLEHCLINGRVQAQLLHACDDHREEDTQGRQQTGD